MNTTTATARPRSNLWALKPRESATTTTPRGTATIATSLPPSDSCDYWVRRFSGRSLDLELPFCTPHLRIAGTALVTPTVTLESDVAERLRALARNELTTPFTVLLAAWQVVLHRHSRQGDFVVGCGTPGGRVSVQERPLLVHATLDGQTGFRTLLRTVAMRRAEGATHGDVPLSDLVRAFGPSAPAGRHPLYQAAFVQRNALSDSTAHATDNRHAAPVDLACVWDDCGKTFRIRIDYPAGVIAPDLAARLPVHVANIVRAAVALPDAPIGTLPMLTSAEYLEKVRS